MKLHLQQLPTALRMTYKLLAIWTDSNTTSSYVPIQPHLGPVLPIHYIPLTWASLQFLEHAKFWNSICPANSTSLSTLSCNVLCMVHSATFRSQLKYYLFRNVSLTTLSKETPHWDSPSQQFPAQLTTVCNYYSSLRLTVSPTKTVSTVRGGTHHYLQYLALYPPHSTLYKVSIW